MLSRRLLIVTGKGGVGKSAVTAALALRAASRGKRVLAVAAMDDAGLATHFGIDQLTYRPREVAPGIDAMRIERPAALNEYLRVQIGVPVITHLGPVARAFDALASTAPGIREVITIGKILYDVREGGWDLVVVDAPPTGQIASLLDAPATVANLVGVGRIRRQTGWMIDLLANPSATGLVVVTLPEELPVTETLETLAWLEEHPIADVAAVIANRTLDPLDVDPDEVPAGPARDAALLHRSLWAEQQEWLEVAPISQTLPYLFGLLTPMEVAARFADLMGST